MINIFKLGKRNIITSNQLYVGMIFSFLLGALIFGSLFYMTGLINDCENTDCRGSGINWSVNEDFYVDFYDSDVLIDEGNTSYDISMMTLLTITIDNDLGSYITENQIEDIYGLDNSSLITHMGSNYWFIGNSSELSVTFNPFMEIDDRINAMMINSSTILDGQSDTLNIDPISVSLALAFSICREGYFFGFAFFMLANITSTLYDFIEDDFTINDCNYLDLQIEGIQFDIDYGYPVELYLTLNDQPITQGLLPL